ncbi:hypothetical protein LSAT2_021967 [Lamellibrachia satsuma]|nr:hypothetical protein LSAT2_021967 [Lamellibrachia satsuma]
MKDSSEKMAAPTRSPGRKNQPWTFTYPESALPTRITRTIRLSISWPRTVGINERLVTLRPNNLAIISKPSAASTLRSSTLRRTPTHSYIFRSRLGNNHRLRGGHASSIIDNGGIGN